MNEPLYKAVHHQKYEDVQLFANLVLRGLTAPNGYYDDGFLDRHFKAERTQRFDAAKTQLADKADYLLNVYLDFNTKTFMVTTTYVFSDRNTALLFKLGLQ